MSNYKLIVDFNNCDTYLQYKKLIKLDNFVYKKHDFLYHLQNVSFMTNDILYIMACKILPQYYLKIVNDKFNIVSTFLHYCISENVDKKIYDDKFTLICNNLFYIRNKVIHYRLNEKIISNLATFLCKNVKKLSKKINNIFNTIIDVSEINKLLSNVYNKMLDLMLHGKEYSKNKADIVHKMKIQKLLSPLPQNSKIIFHGSIEEYCKLNKQIHKNILVRLINTEHNKNQEFKQCKDNKKEHVKYGPRFYDLEIIDKNNSYLYMLNGNYRRKVKNIKTIIEIIDKK